MLKSHRRLWQSVSSSKRVGQRQTCAMYEALEDRWLFATYFVDAAAVTSGNGSSATPFKTIQAAVNATVAGDTVNVRPGNYVERVTIANKVGSSAQPIVIQKSGSGTVNLTDTVQTYNVGVVNFRDSSYVTFDGFSINNGFWSAFEVTRGDHLTIQNCITYHNGASSVHTANTSYFSYRNNISDGDCSQAGTATYRVQEVVSIAGSNYFSLIGNEIKNGTLPASGIGGEGIDTKGSNHGVITYNKVHDIPNKAGIYLGAYSGNTSDMECAFNVVYNCADGIDVTSEAGGLVTDHRIHDNIVYNNRSNGINVTAYVNDGPRQNVSITNNTVYNNGWGSNSWGGGIQVESANATNVRIANNISFDNHFWQVAWNSASHVTASNNLIRGVQQTWRGNQGTVVSDFKFVDQAAFNFKLQYASPARNAGVNTADVSPIDFAGNARQGLPDVGAFEYQNVAPTVAVSAAATQSPATPTLATLSVTGADDAPVSELTYTWTTTGTPPAAVTFSANGTNAAKTTTATFAKGGNYNFLVTIRDAGGLAVTSAVSVTVPDVTAPALSSVVSSKLHGGSGTFNLSLALGGVTKTIEPRLNGASKLIFTFSEPIKAVDNTLSVNEFVITNATFSNATISGSTLTLSLTNVVDRKYSTIMLTGISDLAGNVLTGTATLTVGNLYGDVNRSALVSTTDQQLVKNALLQTVNATNFLLDTNASGGFISVVDQQVIKNNLLHGLS